jgi:hypothetical protein
LAPARRYRWRLERTWDPRGTTLAMVGLNPSTADARTDDPTVRRCIGFARRLGFGRLVLVNLYALRATRPADLFGADDPVGDDNDEHVRQACAAADAVLGCWGFNARWDRVLAVRPLLGPQVSCLGTTAQGHPRHPLYLRADTPLQPWSIPAAISRRRRASTASG